MLRRALGVIAFVLVAGVVSCGDDDDGGGDVGAPCRDDFDCDGRCVRGGDWPGGMCTYSCDFDGDCPDHTACVEEDGGVCAVVCGDTEDCRDYGFEPGYSCAQTDRQGHSGDVPVCRSP